METIATSTEYKGFTIAFRRQSGTRGGARRYFVEAEGFKAEGYESLAGARGAITKRIANDNMGVAYLAPKAATSDDKERASVPALVPTSRSQREGYVSGKVNGRIKRGEYVKPAYLHSYTDDYHNPSRKARKAEEMDRNKRRWPHKHAIYGGKIVR
jgi:hypothetical protein